MENKKLELSDLQYLTKRHMWYDEDIQKTLDYLNTHEDELELFKKELDVCYTKYVDYCNDHDAILNSIKDGYVEAFRNYDSAVLESYINDFEKIILKREHF